jgi:hypothetical protein
MMVTFKIQKASQTAKTHNLSRIVINLMFLITIVGVSHDRLLLPEMVRSIPASIYQFVNR